MTAKTEEYLGLNKTLIPTDKILFKDYPHYGDVLECENIQLIYIGDGFLLYTDEIDRFLPSKYVYYPEYDGDIDDFKYEFKKI